VKAFASLQGKALEPLRGAKVEQLRGAKVARGKVGSTVVREIIEPQVLIFTLFT